MLTRCHRCLGFGIYCRECKYIDRSKSCYECGKNEHKAADCIKEKLCFLCSENNKEDFRHVAGTSSCEKCQLFRETLSEARKKKYKMKKERSTGQSMLRRKTSKYNEIIIRIDG